MAMQRFATVERKMRRDPVFAQLYKQQIDGYVGAHRRPSRGAHEPGTCLILA